MCAIKHINNTMQSTYRDVSRISFNVSRDTNLATMRQSGISSRERTETNEKRVNLFFNRIELSNIYAPISIRYLYRINIRRTVRYYRLSRETDLLAVLELILHGGDVRAQAQDLRLDPGVLSLELSDLGLQCVEILALGTGGPATARVTLTRAHRTPVSRTTGFHP